jgi:D-beta-D-heptose 7-phosphate kinase/D-beta-D-heptose 1-phosphate adenosyltransferase
MTDAGVLANHLNDFVGGRVLVVGDVMLDRYVYGTVERISPEAPIPVVRVEHRVSMPGGAGNVARNVAALGASASLIGIIGDDGAGSELDDLLGALDGVAPMLLHAPDRPTTVKVRYIAGGQQLFRADDEFSGPLSSSLVDSLLAAFGEALPEHDVVVLSDYAKGALDDAVLGPLIERARAAGKPVIADPKSRDLSRYRGASLLTPNLSELASATDLPCGTEDEVAAAAALALERAGAEALLVTLSERGMALARRGGTALHLAAEAREVFDVSGAGDTVAATLGTAVAAGLALDDAARLANAAAGVVVGKLGTAVVHRADLAAALHGRDMRDAEHKLCTAEVAVDRVEQWRRRGQRVTFTNGCFDLIHPGHVALLDQARAAGDRLVVGLNSDASVRRLKGANRPVQHETARATVLASFQSVDLVVIFDEDTPMELIAALRPDVLVKGADYSLDQVVGADLVRSYGGEVVLAQIAPGYSTTGTIAKLVG